MKCPTDETQMILICGENRCPRCYENELLLDNSKPAPTTRIELYRAYDESKHMTVTMGRPYVRNNTITLDTR